MAKPTRKTGFLGKNMAALFESYQLARFLFTMLFWHVTVTQLHTPAWVRDNLETFQLSLNSVPISLDSAQVSPAEKHSA